MFTFVFVVALIALACGALAAFLGESPIGGVITVVIALFLIIVSCARVVPARSVGVEVTFGKVTNLYDSGLHWTKPWAGVKKFPSTIQTVVLQGDGKDADEACVTVRLANQTTACVDVSARWSINTTDKQAIKDLYANWLSFDGLEKNLIIPQVKHAMMGPFDDFDPLKALQDSGQVEATRTLEQQANDQLRDYVGGAITVNALTINLVHYDDTTQQKLNGYAQAVADTRIAGQREQTAAAQRRANDAFAGSAASKDPAVLIQNCLDVTERMAKEGKQLPAGWTCLGNGATPVLNVR